MARISHTSEKSKSSNRPAKKYLEWKSNDKSFEYYDSELKEKLLSEGKTEDEIKENKLANVKVDLPLKFVFLQHYHTIKGWHDASKSKIWSNEVYYIGSETITVRSFGNKKDNLPAAEIATGIYKEMKPKIISAGGKYHRSVYVMLEDGTIANISFKGAVVREWSDFFGDNQSLLDNQWIEVNTAKEQKKGSIKYSTPEFTLGKNLTAKESGMADDTALELKGYLDEYFRKEEVIEAENFELEI
mgnify:CR=1 FL=1